MLPKANRLHKESDFKTVHQKGNFIRGRHLALKVMPNNLKVSRFGIIVSNKISPKPTIRNTIKRRLREIIRLELKANHFKPGLDVVVMTKPSIVTENYQSIERNFLDIAKRAEII